MVVGSCCMVFVWSLMFCALCVWLLCVFGGVVGWCLCVFALVVGVCCAVFVICE